MSENLKKRLSLKLNLKTLDNILSNSSSLKFVEYLEESQDPPVISIWKKIVNFDRQPSHIIPENSSIDDINFQFQEILTELKFDNEVYLSIGSIGNLPWVKVKIICKDMWLVDLWNLGYHELIVLNSNKNISVGLLEEENSYDIHIVCL